MSVPSPAPGPVDASGSVNPAAAPELVLNSAHTPGSVVGESSGNSCITAGGAVLMLINPGVACVRLPFSCGLTENTFMMLSASGIPGALNIICLLYTSDAAD